jgi:uncharacterized protein
VAVKYVDTSAVVKLYIVEPDSAAFRISVAGATQILISRVTALEVASAFYGKVRQGQLNPADAAARLARFEADLPNYEVLSLSEAVLLRSRLLLDTHAVGQRLRPLDAIQVATALEEHQIRVVDALVTDDKDMRAVALANGLAVEP